MSESIELIVDYSCHTGENPIWHSDEQMLYWIDIPQGRIFRYDPQTNQSSTFFEGAVIGGMTIQQDGTLLLFMEAGRIALLKNGALTPVIDKIEAETGKRFNDVIATPTGRVLCGTLSEQEGGKGSLYRFEHDRTIDKVIDEVGIANGMGFSPDLSHFFFTDSDPARKIYRYGYDSTTDQIHDETVFVHLPAEDGFPDGMTVDTEGYIWSACWDGGKVIRYTPSGTIDREIQVPGAKKVASVTFGGTDYSDLYITTAGGNNKDENGANAGALFRVQMDNARGRPEYHSKIELPE